MYLMYMHIYLKLKQYINILEFIQAIHEYAKTFKPY